MKLRTAIVTAASLFFLAQAPAARAWVDKDFKSWSVSCTNGLTCTLTFTDPDSKSFDEVLFRRSGAPNADVELLIPLSNLDTRGQTEGFYAFSVDGKELARIPVAGLKEDDRRYVLVYADQPVLLGLIAAMKAGTKAEMRYEGTLGKRSLAVNLAGLKASLLFMDDMQQRLDRTDALDQKGDKAPPTETELKDITTFEDVPEAIRRDFIAEDGNCSGMEADSVRSYNGFDISVKGIRIILVPCGTGGAYNQPYALYTAIESIERVSFPVMIDGQPSVMTSAYNVDYDPRTGIMTSFFKGRGFGDCGQWYKWSLAGKDESSVPVLLEQRNKDECGGEEESADTQSEAELGPEQFPLEWPVKK